MGKREWEGHALETSVDSLSNALAGVGEVVTDPASIDAGLTLPTHVASPAGNNGAAPEEGSKAGVVDQSSVRGDDWAISESQTAKDYESDKFGFWQASAVNTLNMFGTGPFITVPFLFAATVPAGPQALIGYALAAVVCTCDSTVWGELSSMMPYSGGTYIYLREAYGKDKWGRFMAFLFIFQFLISAPIEIASGYIAMAQYLAYITGITNWVYNSLIGCGFCILSILVLYQDLTFVGKMTIALWVGTVGAIVFTIIAGYANFDASLLQAPSGWNATATLPGFIYSLGTAMRIGIYDFAGYYDACQMGDEVKNPRRVIPRATVWTCVFLVFVFFAVIFAIVGVVPWYGEDGFVEKVLSGHSAANFVMSTFAEILFGRPFAIFFTIVVVYTIFGSCFALLLGYAFIPYSAARDRYFYAWFGHEHATKKGLADYSLLALGAISSVLCFVDLGILIEGMLTTRLIIQFMAQAVGIVILKKKAPNAIRVFTVPLYPLPIIVNLLGFFFVFCLRSACPAFVDTDDSFYLVSPSPATHTPRSVLALLRKTASAVTEIISLDHLYLFIIVAYFFAFLVYRRRPTGATGMWSGAAASPSSPRLGTEFQVAREKNAWVLPDNVLEAVTTILEPSWRGVSRHVSNDFKAAVSAVEATHGPSVMHASDICSSVDVLNWAGEQGCPWRPVDSMAVASGLGQLEVLRWGLGKGYPMDERVCARAARHGHLPALQWAREQGCPWSEDTCANAARGGFLGVLQWAQEQECPWGVDTCSAAAEGGHLATLQWARGKGCPWNEDTCSNAARAGHLAVLQWAREQGCHWDSSTCAAAAEGGHLDILQWARQHGCPWKVSTYTAAVDGGHLEVIEWAREQGCPGQKWICMLAARAGNLSLLQWARQQGCPWDHSTCSLAAEGGHLEVLQWARANGCPWVEWTCAFAARGGHLAVLQWLRGAGAPWDDKTCGEAADKGHLAVLQWAHEHGCPWGESTCARAARWGHVELLRWARLNGCPWDARVPSRAARWGHEAVVRFAWEQSCPWDEDTPAAAALGGHLSILQWVHEQGCPWNEETCASAARAGSLSILQWARSEGCPWDVKTCANAARGGHLHILKWARGQGCPWDKSTWIAAADSGSMELMAWIQANGCPASGPDADAVAV